MVVDQLLQIWEQRQKSQRDRDEWQYKALMVADYAATMAQNVAVDKENRSKSVLNDMFGTGANQNDPVTIFEAGRESIFEAHAKSRDGRTPTD